MKKLYTPTSINFIVWSLSFLHLKSPQFLRIRSLQIGCETSLLDKNWSNHYDYDHAIISANLASDELRVFLSIDIYRIRQVLSDEFYEPPKLRYSR